MSTFIINEIIRISVVGTVLETPENCAVEYIASSKHLGSETLPHPADKLTPQKKKRQPDAVKHAAFYKHFFLFFSKK